MRGRERKAMLLLSWILLQFISNQPGVSFILFHSSHIFGVLHFILFITILKMPHETHLNYFSRQYIIQFYNTVYVESNSSSGWKLTLSNQNWKRKKKRCQNSQWFGKMNHFCFGTLCYNVPKSTISCKINKKKGVLLNW